VIDAKEGRPVPSDFVEARPWLVCFRLLSQDDNYWNEQVRHPATSWLAAGGRGAPMASSEALALAHFPGLSEGHETESGGGGERDDRRRQANRDKRLAKRKRIQSEREELSRFRSSEEKGKGRGKAKTKLAKKFAIAGPKTMAHVQALPLAVIANARSSACTGACCAFHQGTTTCSALRSDISCAGKPRASSLRE
jgi:hypothetical protein